MTPGEAWWLGKAEFFEFSIDKACPPLLDASSIIFSGKRKADTEAVEVRGIFAHPDDHQQIKEEAAKVNRRRTRLVAKRGAP